MKRYLLRTTAKPASRDNPKYLQAVRSRGAGAFLTVWTSAHDRPRAFSPAQRARFEAEHPYVAGRWVLLETARGTK